MRPLFPIAAALSLGLASPAPMAAPAAPAAASAAAVRVPAKAGARTGRTPTSPAVQQAAAPAGAAPLNHDQYALRPEQDVQPRSSFGLRMKPGWQQDDPGR